MNISRRSFSSWVGAAALAAQPAQATSRWLPWMLMGQVPGNLIWRAQGSKFTDPSVIPADSLAAFRRIHPEVFNPVPWTEKRVMYLDYAKQRRPTKP